MIPYISRLSSFFLGMILIIFLTNTPASAMTSSEEEKDEGKNPSTILVRRVQSSSENAIILPPDALISRDGQLSAAREEAVQLFVDFIQNPSPNYWRLISRLRGIARRYSLSSQMMNEAIIQPFLREYFPAPSQTLRVLVPQQDFDYEVEQLHSQRQLGGQRVPLASLFVAAKLSGLTLSYLVLTLQEIETYVLESLDPSSSFTVSRQSGLSPQMINERNLQRSLGYLSSSFQRQVTKVLFDYDRSQRPSLERHVVIFTNESSEEEKGAESLRRRRPSQTLTNQSLHIQEEDTSLASSLPNRDLHMAQRGELNDITNYPWGLMVWMLVMSLHG